ncbi:elongator complex protein 3 [Cyclospora cayetanensis]|uniref:Elongator complex protein 3 n=1 Tax=Cyclospora cayetanensis TaxID=88456 RepID=A0A6P6RPX0_9EIME|nr:elongator complex protein 3 [Cyclospora cayetanensis]
MQAAATKEASSLSDSESLLDWFPATRPEFTSRCGDVKRLAREDLEDPHRRRHLESFRQSMKEWAAYDSSTRNVLEDETADSFLADLVKLKPKTNKEFKQALQALRKKHKVAPAKSQLVAAYNRLLAAERCAEDLQEGSSAQASDGGMDTQNGADCSARNPMLESLMRRKAVRTNSGVVVITVLTAPGRFSCPQDCHYCPNEPGQPRSYLSTEPAVLRANQNGWSPLKQFQDRAGTLKRNGHVVDKIEVLVLGGTWSGYPQDYQEEFIRDIYFAANVFDKAEPTRSPLTLEEEQHENETAACRIVGLTLVGLQNASTLTFCGLLFQVDIHLMPDLPSSSPAADYQMFYYVLSSPDLQADQWKIYPCEVTPFSAIEQWYKEGKYIPYADSDGETLLSLICSVKAAVHPWIRLNRVVRDIPNQSIIGGNSVTNLRQELARELESRHLRCKCIRCREVKDAEFDLALAELCVRCYETNGGVEYFLSFETRDRKTIFGFLRMRLRSKRHIRDCPFSVLNGAALLRELHVYGRLVAHGEAKNSDDMRPQHAGFGRRLIQAAEIVALAKGYRRMAVIAGIGTREYYRGSGYHLEDSYMVKELTVVGLHAGRAELLADQPTQLLVERQDLQRAAASLLLPLPPKVPRKKTKVSHKSSNKQKERTREAEDFGGLGVTAANAVAVQEAEEKAKAFLTEYAYGVEEIDVPFLIRRLRDSETTETQEQPGLFCDNDTFAEYCSLYTALQQKQQCNVICTSCQSSFASRLAAWLLGEAANTCEKHQILLAVSAATAAATCATLGLLWFAARRRY